MTPFINNLMQRFIKTNASTWLNSLKKVTLLQSDIKRLNMDLDNEAAQLLKDQSSSLYISIHDLINVIKDDKFKIVDIIAKSRHITELTSMAYSTIEVYPIVENDHIVLCPDIKTCDSHKDYCGEKIKIVTVR